jgi:hypothetical protein
MKIKKHARFLWAKKWHRMLFTNIFQIIKTGEKVITKSYEIAACC